MHVSEAVNCPRCGCDQIRATLTNSKDSDRVIRQRRCTSCQHRWYTAELPVSVAVVGWERTPGTGKSVPMLRVPVELAVGTNAV
jgi:hypothetical protein